LTETPEGVPDKQIEPKPELKVSLAPEKCLIVIHSNLIQKLKDRNPEIRQRTATGVVVWLIEKALQPPSTVTTGSSSKSSTVPT
jgi:hypothetical protein